MVITIAICFKGVSGIEKASKFMMPALFILLIIIMIRSVTLEGSSVGLRFIFEPKAGFTLSSINAALGQVFYSLSLCMGITITYGSYLSKKENIQKSCMIVAGMDTALATVSYTHLFLMKKKKRNLCLWD